MANAFANAAAADLHDDPQDDPKLKDGIAAEGGPEEEDEDPGEGASAAGLPDAELNEEQLARRQKRRDDKQRKRERDAALVESNRLLLARIANLENNQNRTETVVADTRTQTARAQLETAAVRIDEELTAVDVALEDADAALERSMAEGDAAGVRQANKKIRELTDARADARNAKQQVNGIREEFERRAKQGPQQATKPNPAIVANFTAFKKDFDWFDANGSNVDSRIVQTVDQELAREGVMQPTDPAYWVELRKRIRQYLPHRFSKDAGNGGGEQPRNGEDRGAPPSGGPGQGANGSARNGKWELSRARRDALKAQNLQEGSPEWQEMVNTFRDWDAEQAAKVRRFS